MIELIKKNKSFLTIYLLFAVSVLFLITYAGKKEAQLAANQFHSPFFDAFFFYSTKIVEWFSILVIITILVFKGVKYALNGLLIYGIAALITLTLKRLVFVEAMRPTFNNSDYRLIPAEFGLTQLTNLSFPSGHTTAAFTLFCYMAMITSKKGLGYLYGIIAVVVGYSRVYLSQHFFEDILAGATIGTLTTFVLFYFFDKIKYGNWAIKPLLNLNK